MAKKIIENAQPLPKWADENARSSHYENISKGLAEKPWLLSEDEVRTLMAPGLPYPINNGETIERHRQEPDRPVQEQSAGQAYNSYFQHLYITNSQYHKWLTDDKQQ